MTNRFPANESAGNMLYDLIQQKKKHHDNTEKAVKNLKVKNSEKPPRKENDTS